MDWGKIFQVYNHSKSVLICGVLNIEDEQTVVINPASHPESTIESLKIFEKRGLLDATNEITVVAPASKETFSAKTLDSVNGTGKAIVVNNIDTGGSGIEVTSELMDEAVAREAKFAEAQEANAPVFEEKMTRDDAVALLSAHWKTFQVEVNKITDARKLNFLELVAQEEGTGDKKKQIIADRLNEI